jgi:hypothetical protein
MHPLAPNLSKESNDALMQKYNDLQKRLNQAWRFGPHSIIPQIQMMMEHYRAELAERNRVQMEEILKKQEESGKGYNGIIDIS